MKHHRNMYLSEMERCYAEKYKELPDTTFFKELEKTGSSAQASLKRESRMNKIWQEMKAFHEQEILKENPFLT